MKEMGSCFNCHEVIYDGNLSLHDGDYQCPVCGTIMDDSDLLECEATFWYVSVVNKNGSQEDKYHRIGLDDVNPEKFIRALCESENMTILELTQIDDEEYHDMVDTELRKFGGCSCALSEEEE